MRAGGAARWALAAPALSALGLLLAPRPAGSQTTTEAPAPACNIPNLTQVCDLLSLEAQAACLEYSNFGIGVTECVPWVNLARETCLNSCANCSEVGLALRAQCRFSLQILSNGPLMTRFCEETKESIINYRCPNLLYVNDGRCLTPEADICMRDCGNYGKCMCRAQKGTALGPACTGYTMAAYIDKFPGIHYTCDLTPSECVHYQQSRCGRYHYCEPDLCLIKQVECIPSEDCLMFDMCDRTNGLCYFRNRPDGANCSDGLFYTLDDHCMRGVCVGTPNNCVRYNVSCDPYSPCLRDGQCHPHSGRCTFNMVPDGVACDDRRAYTLEDQCQSGSCVGRPVDLCIERGVVCTAPNSCFDAGTCDPATGRCSDAEPSPDPRPCDDGDPATDFDRCIDGLCLGKVSSGVQFLTLGTGECSDREGGRMARYSGDVEDEQACMALCREDPQCAAYSYAFPLCSVYGTVRIRAPSGGKEWAFQEGSSNPVAISVETAELSAVGQRAGTCRRKGMTGDTPVDYGAAAEFRADDFFEPWKVAVFFVVVIMVFLAWPIMHALERCFCASSSGIDNIFVDELPQETVQPDSWDVQGEQLRVTADNAVDGLPDLPSLDNTAPAAEPRMLPGETNELPAIKGQS